MSPSKCDRKQKKCENRVRRLEVIAFLAKVVNVPPPGSLNVYQENEQLGTLSLIMEMLGNYNCDYGLGGNLPIDRQISVRKKERKKDRSMDRSQQTKPVNKETAVNERQLTLPRHAAKNGLNSLIKIS